MLARLAVYYWDILIDMNYTHTSLSCVEHILYLNAKKDWCIMPGPSKSQWHFGWRFGEFPYFTDKNWWFPTSFWLNSTGMFPTDLVRSWWSWCPYVFWVSHMFFHIFPGKSVVKVMTSPRFLGQKSHGTATSRPFRRTWGVVVPVCGAERSSPVTWGSWDTQLTVCYGKWYNYGYNYA